jgi:hypothetical protein
MGTEHGKDQLPRTKKRKLHWKEVGRYTGIPRVMIADRRLDSEALRLALILKNYEFSKVFYNRKQPGILFPPVTRIADHLSCSKPTAEKYLRQLEHAGYLKIVPRPGQSNHFVQTMPCIESVEMFVSICRIYANRLTIDDCRPLIDEDSLDGFKRFFECVDLVKMQHTGYARWTSKFISDDTVDRESLLFYQWYEKVRAIPEDELDEDSALFFSQEYDFLIEFPFSFE